MKPTNLNQLLFHPKNPCLSFFQAPLKDDDDENSYNTFFTDMLVQLEMQGHESLARVVTKQRTNIRKVLKSGAGRPCGFFISESLQGYIILDELLESFCMMGFTFHVRPLLEQLFVNPEFMIVNISLFDIKVYKADFHHVDIIQHYEFDEMPANSFDHRVFAPEYMGLIPYKSILALKTVAHRVMESTQYHSFPVIVTGIEVMRKNFLKHYEHASGVLSHFDEDFYEKTCMEILERCKVLRPAIMDFYSAQLKERLKRMMKSKKYVSDLPQIIKAAMNGRIMHLILPVEKKIWGNIDFATGEYEIHKKPQKKVPSIDILNELAKEVMKSGGKIQFLGPHFFPTDSQVLAILKGSET